MEQPPGRIVNAESLNVFKKHTRQVLGDLTFMTVTDEFECVITKDGYELYVRKVCPIRKNDTSRLQDLVSNGTEANI